MKTLLTLPTGIVALLAYLLLAGSAFAQSETMIRQRTIAVTGESHEQIQPDQAVLSLSIVSKNKNLAQAKQENDAQAERVVTITRQFDIPKDKVATSSLYISPEYNYTNNGEQRFVGYIVSRSLRITMDRLDVHERLLSALVEANVDQIGGLEFLLSKPEVKAAALRLKAYEDARGKAAALAQAAGVKLGHPISISTAEANTPIGAPPMPMMAMKMAGAEMAGSVAPTLPGMIELRQTVNVVFAME